MSKVNNQPDPMAQVVASDYRTWRHHPVTKVLLSYLTDYRGALQEKALAHLLQDSSEPFDLRYVGEIGGRIKAVSEIIDLPFEAIQSFYQKDEENEATLDAESGI